MGISSSRLLAVAGMIFLSTPVMAQDLGALVERGKELFDSDVGCWVCHSDTGAVRRQPTYLISWRVIP